MISTGSRRPPEPDGDALLLSVARLTAVLRRPFTRHIDKIEIGRQDSDRWLSATELMIDVHYTDLARDPLATVAAIYRHFGIVMAPAAADAIRRLVAAKPDGGYGARRCRFAEHGLDAARERERYRRYTAHFAIRPEVEAGPSTAPGGAAGIAAQPSAVTGD